MKTTLSGKWIWFQRGHIQQNPLYFNYNLVEIFFFLITYSTVHKNHNNY